MKDIFNKEVKKIVLNNPDSSLYEAYRNILTQGTTVPYLNGILYTFRSLYRNNIVYVKDPKTGKESLSEIVEKIKAEKNTRKADIVDFLSLFLADEENLNIYFTALDSKIKELWKLVFDKHFVSKEEAGQVLGVPAVISDRYSYREELIPALPWFKLYRGKSRNSNNRYCDEDYFITVSSWVYNAFFYAVYPPDTFFILPEDFNPLPEGLEIFEGEETFIREYPMMVSLQEQKFFAVESDKKLSVSALKKISGQIGACEFFPDSTDLEACRLRTSLLYNLFAHNISVKRVQQCEKEPELAAKELIEKFNNYAYFMVPLFLVHITGLRKDLLWGNALKQQHDAVLVSLAEDADKWIDIRNIYLNVSYSTQGDGLTLFSDYALQRMNLKDKNDGQIISSDLLVERLGKPYIQSYLFLLASLGIIDIAYNKSGGLSYDSGKDCIRYAKLTELGKYVLGINASYSPAAVCSAKKYFELDRDRLIVKSLEKNNPYEKMLADISSPIGGGRYVVSNASFLKNCKTVAEISGKISFFRQFVSEDWSDIWQAFFESIQMKCNPLNREPSDNYIIYSLDPKNAELINLISNDYELKKTTIRAEGFMILVAKSRQGKFLDRLKSFGYMV